MYACVCVCAGSKDADRSQVERDGRALGAAAVLSSCLSFWRAIFRDPMLFACGMHALMASRAYTSMQAQVRSCACVCMCVCTRAFTGEHACASWKMKAGVLCVACQGAGARARLCMCPM